jgi:hypothetical protein
MKRIFFIHKTLTLQQTAVIDKYKINRITIAIRDFDQQLSDAIRGASGQSANSITAERSDKGG